MTPVFMMMMMTIITMMMVMMMMVMMKRKVVMKRKRAMNIKNRHLFLVFPFPELPLEPLPAMLQMSQWNIDAVVTAISFH